MRNILENEIKKERCNASALGAYNASVGSEVNWRDQAQAEKTADNFKESIRSYLYDEKQVQLINEKGYDLTDSDQNKLNSLEDRMRSNIKSLALVYKMSENEVIGNINSYSDPGTRKEWFAKFKKKISKQ